MAIVTAVYECKGGPADGEVVELPWDAAECVLEHAVTDAGTGTSCGRWGDGYASARD